MAKPNYAYEKRQRELEKKKKKAEKANRKPGSDATDAQQPDGAGDAPAQPAAEPPPPLA